MKSTRSKKKSQQIHAKRRAWERKKLLLTNKDLYELGQQIINGSSEFIRSSSNTRKIHYVTYEDQRLKVVWDNKRHQITTVLTERMK